MFLPYLKHLTRFLRPDYKWTLMKEITISWSQLDSSCTNRNRWFTSLLQVRWDLILGASIKLKFSLVILRYEGWLIIFTAGCFYWKLLYSVVHLPSCVPVHNPMKYSTLGLPQYIISWSLPQIHPHCISDAIRKPSHPVMPSAPSALNFSQH